MDRTYDDHLVLIDLAFTDVDIEWAMKACARKFNSIKPIFYSIDPEKMPMSTSTFLDGCAWALLRRWARNARMNDIDYQAGGVSASVQGKLIKNLSDEVAKLEQDFVSSSMDLKMTANIRDAFGQIG